MQLTNLNIYTILVFFLLVSLVLFLFYSFYKRREKLKTKYILLFNQYNFFYVKYIVLIISFVILLLNIFNIKYGNTKTVKTHSLDIVFILDVSKSMNVKDFKVINKNAKKYISRLNIAKSLIKTYILNNKNNNYGLVIFAGEASSIIPLTSEYSVFLDFLENVNYKNLNTQGTNIYNALRLGLNRFNISSNESKVIILISDGGDIFNKNNLNSIKKLFNNLNNFFNREKYTSLVIGIGTKLGGKILKNSSDGAIEKILNNRNLQNITNSLSSSGDSIYEKYNGNVIISKLNYKYLKSISNTIGGTYFEIKNTKDFSKISNTLDNLESKSIITSQERSNEGISRVLVFLSLMFFMIYLTIVLFKQR